MGKLYCDYKYLISISSLKVYNCKIVASVSHSVSQFALVIVLAMQCCEATTTTVNRRQQSGAFEKKSLLSLSLLASTKKSRYFLGKILVASISREYRGEVGRKKTTTKVNRQEQSGVFVNKTKNSLLYWLPQLNNLIFARKDLNFV